MSLLHQHLEPSSYAHQQLWTFFLYLQHSCIVPITAGALRLASLLPKLPTGSERKAAAAAVQAWLKSLPLARRPLVKSSVQLMTEAGIAQLQLQLGLATFPTVSMGMDYDRGCLANVTDPWSRDSAQSMTEAGIAQLQLGWPPSHWS